MHLFSLDIVRGLDFDVNLDLGLSCILGILYGTTEHMKDIENLECFTFQSILRSEEITPPALS